MRIPLPKLSSGMESKAYKNDDRGVRYTQMRMQCLNAVLNQGWNHEINALVLRKKRQGRFLFWYETLLILNI